MAENGSAFYVHCFSHQLQLTLVAVAGNHVHAGMVFKVVSNLLNVVGSSCKHRDILQEKEAKRIMNALESGEIISGKGLNQETSLKRPGDMRWGSFYGAVMNLIIMFSSVINVLDVVEENGSSADQRMEANVLLIIAQSFEFAFNLHLMRKVLGITNELSQALQKKDQDIVNATGLVKISKQLFQDMRNDGWEALMEEVTLFCVKHNIQIPNMNEKYIVPGRSRRIVHETTNLHHYWVEIFYTFIDMQLQELNRRFNETTTELLLCMACLDPSDAFVSFNKPKLIRFANLYPSDFSPVEIMALGIQLDTYILDVRSSNEFSKVKGIGGLAEKLVEMKKDIVYPFVYLLLKLALLLPVATATVERAFSAMKIVKNRSRSQMGDDWMNDCLVTDIERDVFETIDNETIMMNFQNMKARRGML